MKAIFILTAAILFLSFTPIDTKKHYYSNGKQKDQVEINNGMFNGNYTAWYYNGKKKAEGTFKNNQRVGKWTVYDSLGNIRMVREYENNFTFKTLTAKNEKGDNITLPEKVNYDLKRNSDGVYGYTEINEKDMIFSKINWRTIENNTSNNLLFENNKVLDMIRKNINATGKPVAYSTYEFTKYFNVDSVKRIINNENIALVKYKINEVMFYDASWQLSETRIIGICPVVKDNANGNESELFWIYYPEFRSLLATEKVTIKDDKLITNLEDVFFFRNFSSSIYKEEGIYDRALSESYRGSTIVEVAEKTEMDMFDMEHDLWISLTEKK